MEQLSIEALDDKTMSESCSDLPEPTPLIQWEFRGKISHLRLGTSIRRIAKVWSERQIIFKKLLTPSLKLPGPQKTLLIKNRRYEKHRQNHLGCSLI